MKINNDKDFFDYLVANIYEVGSHDDWVVWDRYIEHHIKYIGDSAIYPKLWEKAMSMFAFIRKRDSVIFTKTMETEDFLIVFHNLLKVIMRDILMTRYRGKHYKIVRKLTVFLYIMFETYRYRHIDKAIEDIDNIMRR